MPFGSEKMEAGIGLALSGGGFRATLFHLGTLWRLNELAYLPKLDRISSISGGSITAGVLAVHWNELAFQGGVAGNFDALITQPLRSFCARNIDGPAIGEGALLPWKSISEAVEEEYREHLFQEAHFQQLPDRPRFVINATNFCTGVSFRFSKPYAGDYRIGLIEKPTFRVSLAVTASSAFPPFLSPVEIKPDPAAFKPQKGSDLYDNIEYRKKLLLTDGGVYDNLGLETVWNRYDTVLVSDAGAPFNVTNKVDTAWLSQSMRALDVTTNQARGLRKRALISDFGKTENGFVRKGTYWGISTDITDYATPNALPCNGARVAALAGMRTRLNKFNEQEQCELINWGYVLCDAAMRRYVLPPPDPAKPVPAPAWPYPTWKLDRP